MPPRKAAPRKLELDEVCVIREGDREYCIYPLGDLMRVLGRKWTLFVIAVLGNRERIRFNEMLADLRFISSRSLADRLRELEAAGLVSRQVISETPPRVEYRLTPEGRDVRALLVPLLQWTIEWEKRTVSPEDVSRGEQRASLHDVQAAAPEHR